MRRGGEGGLGRGPQWCACAELRRRGTKKGAELAPRQRKGRASAPRCSPPRTPSPAALTSNQKQPTVSGLLHSRRAPHRHSPSAKTFRPRAAAGTTGPRDEKELSARDARGAWGVALRTLWAGRPVSEKLPGSSCSVPLIAKILRRPPPIPVPTRPRLRRALGCEGPPALLPLVDAWASIIWVTP